jgi:thioredoxin 1
MQTANDSTFRERLNQKEVTLVDFSAPWCTPCKALLPILEHLDREHGKRLSILKVDCDESPGLASRFGVMSMPTVILFHKGEPVEKLVGLRPKSVYDAALARYFK